MSETSESEPSMVMVAPVFDLIVAFAIDTYLCVIYCNRWFHSRQACFFVILFHIANWFKTWLGRF